MYKRIAQIGVPKNQRTMGLDIEKVQIPAKLESVPNSRLHENLLNTIKCNLIKLWMNAKLSHAKTDDK